MSNEVRALSREVRLSVAEALEPGRSGDGQAAADAVSRALVRAAINVNSISLEDWKALIFDAFQATRSGPASTEGPIPAAA